MVCLDGRGILEEERKRVLERFCRAKHHLRQGVVDVVLIHTQGITALSS